jgi:hypothetical protein
MNNFHSIFYSIITLRPIPWETVTTHLHEHRDDIYGNNELPMLRRRIECDGGTATTEQLELLIDMYPKELAFSLLLCTARFPVHSIVLMNKIFQAIEDYSEEQMDYCIQKFQGDKTKRSNADTVVGEAMTLVFSFFDDYVATTESGNKRALYLIKQRYPKSILYIDGHEFTPLHGVCCALNMDIFRFFIKWHLDEAPNGRGGLYCMNDSGISSMDTLIDTQQDIVPQLEWLRSRKLLKSKDVEDWLLVHRSAHSSSRETIKFFVDLYPSGVMSEDDDGNLPITLHLGLRYRSRNSFTEEDYAITKLLVTKGIENGGIDTIGGLFHKEPDEEKSCTLDALLKEVGEASREKLWGMIDEWVEEVTGGDYTLSPIVHAAILNKEHMSTELYEYVMSRYETNESNEDGVSPLMYAVALGAKWDGCVCQLLNKNLEELNSSEDETMLPILPFAASRKDPDISMLYELTRRSPWMFRN